MNYIATIQLLCDTPKELADDLRAIADQIESQGTLESHDDHKMIVHVRKWESGKEEPINAGRYWTVGQSDAFPGEAIAIFASKEHADRMVEGKPIFDEEDGPQNDLCVTRARIVGTLWNSYDPDPEDAPRPPY